MRWHFMTFNTNLAYDRQKELSGHIIVAVSAVKNSKVLIEKCRREKMIRPGTRWLRVSTNKSEN